MQEAVETDWHGPTVRLERLGEIIESLAGADKVFNRIPPVAANENHAVPLSLPLMPNRP
ncbi:MAG: hypothetical protein ACLU93_00470 [Streptococcus sp.]